MAYKVTIMPVAQLDIWEIIDWYKSQNEGVGIRFSEKVNRLLLKISKSPTFYSYYKEDFRRAIVKNFSYLIIFKVIENEVFIISVMFGGRNPQLINLRIS